MGDAREVGDLLDPDRWRLTPEQAAANDRRVREWEAQQGQRRQEAAARQCIAALQSNLGRYRDVSLDAYELHSGKHADEQRQVLERMRGMVARIRDVVDGGYQVIWFGSVGTGKDHFACCALLAAARLGYPVRWLPARDYYDECAAAFSEGRTQHEVYREWSRPRVVCISDPVFDDAKTNWQEYLNRLVRRRYDAGRPTWVTCNVADPDRARELFGADVWSRLTHKGVLIRCRWEDYRAATTRQASGES